MLYRDGMSAHLVIVPVAFEFLKEIFTVGHRFDSRVWCKSGLPEGAELVDVFHDRSRWPTSVCCVFKHESFSLVPDGGRIPELTPVFVRDQPELDVIDFEYSPLVEDVTALLKAVSDSKVKWVSLDGNWRQREPLL